MKRRPVVPGARYKLRQPGTVAFAAALLLVLIGAAALHITTRLNTVASAMVFLVYVACVWLIPAGRLPGFHRMALWTFLTAVLLHVAYELTQSIFYTHFTQPGYTYVELVFMLWGATVGDGVIALALFFVVTVMRGGRWEWPWGWRSVVLTMALALVVQVAVEIGALRAGLWAYNAQMPRLPVVNVGLAPALQMPLLMPLTLWLAAQVSCAPPG